MEKSILSDERYVETDELFSSPHSRILQFEEVVNDLISPDSGEKLSFDKTLSQLNTNDYTYPIKNGIPILYPSYLTKPFMGKGLEMDYYSDSRLQYFLLSQIKQKGEINAPSTSIHYQRHLFRMKEFMKPFSGKVLDIGCDDVNIGASLCNDSCTYVGIDPFSSFNGDFKIVATGEFLPFKNESFDVVMFNTSLDHILDYHTGIDEAFRILKPGGVLIVSTIIWKERANLLSDAVHFHHFREYEISGCLSEKGILVNEIRYNYKSDMHRYGLYVAYRKNKA